MRHGSLFWLASIEDVTELFFFRLSFLVKNAVLSLKVFHSPSFVVILRQFSLVCRLDMTHAADWALTIKYMSSCFNYVRSLFQAPQRFRLNWKCCRFSTSNSKLRRHGKRENWIFPWVCWRVALASACRKCPSFVTSGSRHIPAGNDPLVVWTDFADICFQNDLFHQYHSSSSYKSLCAWCNRLNLFRFFLSFRSHHLHNVQGTKRCVVNSHFAVRHLDLPPCYVKRS